ncbi:uncharacterized protein LOC108931298 isoform X1 [Arapaima gigas]
MSSPASLLLLLLLVDSGPAKTGAQGQKPKIDVNVKVVPVDGSLTVTCEVTYSLRGHNCNLYRNGQVSYFLRVKSEGNTCRFSVTGRDLLQGLTQTRPYTSLSLSCDNSGNQSQSPQSDEVTIRVYDKQHVLRLTVTPTVLSFTDSVSLQCEGPQSELLSGSHCWFFSNDSKLNEVPTDCQLSLSGDRLVSRELRAVNLVNLQCSSTESRDGFDVPSVRSGPVSVTVYGLVKPNIRVSRQDTQLQVHCEAPASVTGAEFYLLEEGSLNYTDTVRAAAGETSVTFHAAYRSSSVKYCCRYQYRQVNSDLSDCTGEQHTGSSVIIVGVAAAAVLLLIAVMAVFVCVRRRQAAVTRSSCPPKSDPIDVAVGSGGQETHEYDAVGDPSCHSSAALSSHSDVTYSTLNHQGSASKLPTQQIEGSVVYSSVNTH